MKIVFYNHTGQVSGAEKMLLLSLGELNARGHSVALLCPEAGQLWEEAHAAGFVCEAVAPLRARFTWRPDHFASYLLSVVRTANELRKRMLALAPDVIHANSTRAGIAATLAMAGTGVPIVWHVHDMLPRHPISGVIRMLVLLSRRTHVITCSRSAASAFSGWLKQVGREPHTIYNGIVFEKYRPEPGSRERVRRELGLTDGEFAIGIVGQITRRKGHLELVRAFSAIAARVPHARLYIAGESLFNRDQEYRDEIIGAAHFAEISGKVRFLGGRSDIPAVMSALDLLVLNSTVEPLGLVILEAMMAGTPVLATDSGGPGEIIKHGYNGHLVPPGDRRKLEEALVTLVLNREVRRLYSKRGPAHVARRYSAKRYIDNLEDFYRRALSIREGSAGRLPGGAVEPVRSLEAAAND